MVIKKNLTLFVNGEKKKLNLMFGSSFTRIAVGTNENKTNSGFTKYFKQLKKEVERGPDAEQYIFIFTVKDWEKNREKVLEAEGKIIIIDNAGLTLFADDDMMNELDTGDLLFKNQFIVKDSLDDVGQAVNLGDLDWEEIQIAWLTEVKRHDYTEVRLTYKDKLTALGGRKWLFTDRETAERYGLTVVSEPRDTEYDGTDEFDVLDVTGWDSEAILEHFAVIPTAHVLSETGLDDDILNECAIALEDTDRVHNVWYMKHYGFSELKAAKVYYQVKEKAANAKFVGPVTYKGNPLVGSMYYLWDSKEGGSFVTVVIVPGLESVTFEIERYEPYEEGRFSLRFVEKDGLTDGDAILLIGALVRQMEQQKKMEGRLFWEMGVETC